MAAITKVKPRLVSPVGYESAQHGYATEDLEAGDLVVIDSSGSPDTRWDVAYEEASAGVAHGIVLKDCKAGGTVDVAYAGEMDGFSGLTPGSSLSVASGEIDDTPPEAEVSGTESDGTVEGTATVIPYSILAVSATRIRFRFG